VFYGILDVVCIVNLRKMENIKVIELLNEVLLSFENLVNKLDENGWLSMTRIARSRGESLEYFRRKYENAVADFTHYTTSHHGHACAAGPDCCECGYGYDEVD